MEGWDVPRTLRFTTSMSQPGCSPMSSVPEYIFLWQWWSLRRDLVLHEPLYC